MRSDSVVEEIRNRLDIVEVVGDYVELKRAGTNYKAPCPFHAEKTPSFMVSPIKQIYHCFGCGAGGDLFSFVMNIEGVEFKEALAILAKRAGIELRAPDKKDQAARKGREAVREMQNEALLFFTESLGKSSAPREYLHNRGISPESVKNFSLGFAPQGWHNLFDRLKKRGFKEEDILRSGVIAKGQRGPYDIFRERIIFPIFDRHAAPIAFGGRVMGKGEPKYLNSPDTPIFNKSETLYAFERAKEEIRRKDYAIVVEGYLDAIMCHQYGFINTVAPLGTALTPGHLKLVSRLSRNVLLVFDGDRAGINAAKRSLGLIIEAGMQGKVLVLPEGEDPDSILRTHGTDGMKGQIGRAQTPMVFLMNTSGNDRVKAIREAVSMIGRAQDPIMRDELLRQLAECSGTREQTLREELIRLGQISSERLASPLSQKAKTVVYDAEVLLLSAAVHNPLKARDILERVEHTEFQNPVVYGFLQRLASSDSPENIEILDLVENEEERALVTRLSVEPGFDKEQSDAVIEDCLKKLNALQLESKIRSARHAGDLKLLSRLYNEKQKLLQGTQ